MQYRPLGRTGFNVSTISFGAWAFGGTWRPVTDDESIAALHAALDVVHPREGLPAVERRAPGR